MEVESIVPMYTLIIYYIIISIVGGCVFAMTYLLGKRIRDNSKKTSHFYLNDYVDDEPEETVL